MVRGQQTGGTAFTVCIRAVTAAAVATLVACGGGGGGEAAAPAGQSGSVPVVMAPSLSQPAPTPSAPPSPSAAPVASDPATNSPAAPAAAPTLVAHPADVANTGTRNNQNVRGIGALATGGHVVAWVSQELGAGAALFVQRYDANGAKSGGETRVAYTMAQQEDPAIAVLRDGSIVVASVASRAAMNEPSAVTWTVYARRFDAGGAATGEETVAASFTHNQTGSQSQRFYAHPTLAPMEDGGFALGWAHAEETYVARVQTLHVQRFDARMQPVGGRRDIGPAGGDGNLSLRLVPLPGGDYVAGTTHRFQGTGYVQYGVGTTEVGPWQDADAGLPEFNTTLLPLVDGRFALWSTGRSGGYLQMLDAAGRPTGAATSVAVVPETAVALADGGWVTIQRQMPGEPFLAHRFDAAGRALGASIEVATGMSRPLPASAAGNGLVLAWTFTGAGNDSDVRTQRIDAR